MPPVLNSLMDTVRERHALLSASIDDLPVFVLVFFTCFLTAKLGLYIYYTFHTSPALIWPPVGIAIAAVLFRGYWMCVPIFLAEFLALATQSPHITPIIFINSVAYTIQAAVAAYLFKKFKFEPAFDTLRNTLVLVGVAFLVTLIEPAIVTMAQSFLQPLASPILVLGRAWGAGVFSVLVFTPFIIVWSQRKSFALPKGRGERIELTAAFALLLAVNYFLFWTPYPAFFGISVIFFVPAVLIWFALSLYPRWMTLALIVTSVQGIAGTLLVHPSTVATNAQLLSDEVYIGLVAAIFLVFVAVVEERREAYDRLQTAYKSTSASDQAKSDFIAILAHELRNPLAPIVSSLEWLRLQPATEETSEVLINAQEHADMMRRLLDDLLDTARLSQRKLKLQRKNISLRKVIEQSATSAREVTHTRDQDLVISTPAKDITMYADSLRLKQVVINLLTNASKYSNKGSKIQLSLSRKDNEAIIRVTDEGIGIARDKFAYIFEPFKQVGSAERRDAGLGVGLFLAKNLVEMHRGRIEAASKGVGHGSTFSVYLPLSPQKVNETASPDAKKVSTVSTPRRILVVDDNESAANALQRLLQHYGHQVETAYGGKQALQMIEAFQPHFVLLDIGMPDMDGYAVARKIRSQDLGMTIVALSGYGQESDKLQSKEAGFNHHLVKPVNTSEILALLA